MTRYIGLALLKALVITVGFNLICVIYGAVSKNPYETTLAMEVIFFLVLFVISFIEYLWENRKKSRKK